MREINPGVLVEIVVYVLPVLLVISDFLALHANRNDAAQRRNLGDILDHQQSKPFSVAARQRACCYQKCQVLQRRTLLDMQVHPFSADCLSI